MKVRPLLAAPFAAAAGIALAAAHGPGSRVYLLGAGVALLAIIVRLAGLRLALMLLAIAAVGAGRYDAQRRARVVPDGVTRTVIGTVVTPPVARGGGSSFLVDAHGERLLVQLRGGAPPAWGQTVRFRSRRESPPRPTNPGEFDYAAYLERQGVFAISRVRSLEVLSHPVAPSFCIAAWLRARVERVCRERLADAAPVASGILLSLTDEIEPDLRDDFAVTGTVHILSTSGMHLAVVAGALHLLLRRQRPLVRAATVLGVVWLIALAAGFGPAVLRSALALTVALVAPVLRRDPEPLHAIALAALTLLLAWPMVLWDPGAQLSFATVTILLVGMPIVERLTDGPDGGLWESSLRPKLAVALGAGLLAYAASVPLTAFHFHLVSLVAPIANLPVAALSEVTLLAGAVGVGLDNLGPAVTPIWLIVTGAVEVLVAITRTFADSPDAAASALSPPSSLVVVALAALVAALRRVHVHVVRSRLFRR